MGIKEEQDSSERDEKGTSVPLVRTFQAAAQSGVRLVSHGGRIIGGLFGVAFAPVRPPQIVPKEASPEFGFALSMMHYGRDVEFVDSVIKKSWTRFWLYSVTALGICGACAWTVFSMPHSGVLGTLITASAVITPVMAFVVAMRQAFYNWQVRFRRNGSFFEWLRSPSQWVPKRKPEYVPYMGSNEDVSVYAEIPEVRMVSKAKETDLAEE